MAALSDSTNMSEAVRTQKLKTVSNVLNVVPKGWNRVEKYRMKWTFGGNLSYVDLYTPSS